MNIFPKKFPHERFHPNFQALFVDYADTMTPLKSCYCLCYKLKYFLCCLRWPCELKFIFKVASAYYFITWIFLFWSLFWYIKGIYQYVFLSPYHKFITRQPWTYPQSPTPWCMILWLASRFLKVESGSTYIWPQAAVIPLLGSWHL